MNFLNFFLIDSNNLKKKEFIARKKKKYLKNK